MTTSMPADRAFVVWLSKDSEPEAERLYGRVEHLHSGRRTHFASEAELMAFVTLVLLEEKSRLEDE